MTRNYRRAVGNKPVAVKSKKKKKRVDHGTEKKPKSKSSFSFGSIDRSLGKKKKPVKTAKTVKSPRKVKSLKLPADSEAIVHSLLTPTKDENEQLVLIRHKPNGDTVYFVQEGDNDSIKTDPKYYRGKKNSMTEIHTHPRNSPHSDEDIWTLLTHDQVKKSEVLTSDDIIYIMAKSSATPSASQIDRDEFDDNWTQSIKEAEKLHAKMKTMPTGAQKDDDRAFHILVDQKMAEKYDLKWDVAKREEQIAAHAEKTIKHFELSNSQEEHLVELGIEKALAKQDYSRNPESNDAFDNYEAAVIEEDDFIASVDNADKSEAYNVQSYVAGRSSDIHDAKQAEIERELNRQHSREDREHAQRIARSLGHAEQSD